MAARQFTARGAPGAPPRQLRKAATAHAADVAERQGRLRASIRQRDAAIDDARAAIDDARAARQARVRAAAALAGIERGTELATRTSHALPAARAR